MTSVLTILFTKFSCSVYWRPSCDYFIKSMNNVLRWTLDMKFKKIYMLMSAVLIPNIVYARFYISLDISYRFTANFNSSLGNLMGSGDLTIQWMRVYLGCKSASVNLHSCLSCSDSTLKEELINRCANIVILCSTRFLM